MYREIIPFNLVTDLKYVYSMEEIIQLNLVPDLNYLDSVWIYREKYSTPPSARSQICMNL